MKEIVYARFGPRCIGASSRSAAVGISLVVFYGLLGCGSPHRYSAEGRIVGFGDDGVTVIIAHTDIPGFMPAMTMPFTAKSMSELADKVVGDAVRFDLLVAQDSSWIQSVTKIDGVAVAPITSGNGAPHGPVGLIVGERVPPFTLVNQSGQRRVLFGGNPQDLYVVDFIYTRCPLPEFCPLMSRKFQQIQSGIRADDLFGVSLVSVTVDPDFDTAAVLSAYAQRYDADPVTWNFYSGDTESLDSLYTYFGISLFDGADQAVVHPQFAALVGGDGRLLKLWRDASWNADVVLQEIRERQ